MSNDWPLSQPRIVCAANRSNSGVIAIGIRHYCPIMRENIRLSGVSFIGSEQGFIDQHGFFYDRRTAWRIAFNNGQIFKLVDGQEYKPEGCLYSENLY